MDVRPVDEQEASEMQKDLDDADVKGVSLNALSRVELMSKLARDEVHTSSSRGTTVSAPPTQESRCIVLKNMFDPDE